jgi:deazaflavin-dependent oxidoreductase (nitroreductase family)
MTAVVSLLGILLAGLVALLAIFLGGMRTKWPPVVTTVRRMNLRLLNPRQMETAGQPGAFAGVLRHTGRTSGATYETPVGIEPTDDGFVIALVYGEAAQWPKNVMAAGEATIVKDGVTYAVDRPQIVPLAEAIGFFAASDRRLFPLFGVEQCLRLYRVETAD